MVVRGEGNNMVVMGEGKGIFARGKGTGLVVGGGEGNIMLMWIQSDCRGGGCNRIPEVGCCVW